MRLKRLCASHHAHERKCGKENAPALVMYIIRIRSQTFAQFWGEVGELYCQYCVSFEEMHKHQLTTGPDYQRCGPESAASIAETWASSWDW